MFDKTKFELKNTNMNEAKSVNPVRSVTPGAYDTQIACQVYRRRWVMLLLFTMVSMNNAFHWCQFSIIADVITKYYSVPYIAVDWLSMIYMLVYIFLVIPGDKMTEKRGLKTTVMLGIGLSTIGAWILVGSVSPDRYYVTYISQGFLSVAQVFILGIPSRLAAEWFGPDQVSSACAIGVFGNQVGIALGFIIPPFLVPNSNDMNVIGTDLLNMYYGLSVFSTALLLCVIFIFQSKPPLPPSPSRISDENAEPTSYKISLVNLLKCKPFLMLNLGYGLNVGVFYAISTLLNQLILPHFPGRGKDAGLIGLCIVISGMLGSVICGICLDKTKKFRETTIVVYILSFACMVAFTFTLYYVSYIELVYVTASLLGFFMTGYLPIGFEYGVELTYPESESTSSAILNISAQITGIIFTTAGGQLLNHNFSDLVTNIMFSSFLLIGIGVTLLTRGKLRRQEAVLLSESRLADSANSISSATVSDTISYDTFPENGDFNK